MFLGEEFDNKILSGNNFNQVLSLLPQFDESKYINNRYIDKSLELEKIMKKIDSDIQTIDDEIVNVSLSISTGESYENSIIKLTERIPNEINLTVGNSKCPFCNSETHEIHDNLTKLKLAQEKLNDELQFVDSEKENRFKVIRLELENKKSELMIKRKEYLRQKKALKSRSKAIRKRDDLYAIIQNKKSRIEDRIKRIVNNDLENFKKVEEQIKASISFLNGKIYGYNIKEKLKEAEFIIQNFMNEIVGKLDFEESFRPINLKFDLATFNLYQQMETERIFLSSMGSGANWLSCHIGLFLGLHYYFAKMGKKCSIPSFLFLDQPSQIYFPEKYNLGKPIDYEKVEMIYNTINYAIKKIKTDTNVDLQVIIMDHADGLELVETDFDDNVIKRWKEESQGFITKDNVVR